MDKNLAREFKYRYGKGNLSLQFWNNLKVNFNENLPIRPSNKWSPSQVNDLKEDLQIFLNQLELMKSIAPNYPEVEEYYRLFCQWNEDNNNDIISRMKEIEKSVRLSNYPYEVQSILTFHRSYDFCPSTKMQNSIKKEYIDEYMSDIKYEGNDYHFDPLIISGLYHTLISNIKYKVENNLSYNTPSCSSAFSPIGEKRYDIKCIRNLMLMHPLIEEVYDQYTSINEILEVMNLPQFNFNKLDGEITQSIMIANLKLLPRLNIIPNPGKMRPVFMSNDLYDVVLDPFKVIVESCYKSLQCSYSSKRIIDDNYLNVDIPSNVRRCNRESARAYRSGLVNSDLTSATDKMFYKFQENIILDILNLFNEDDINLLSSYFNIKDIRKYISMSLRLLSHSYIGYEYLDSNNNTIYGIKIPKYGQCQGQRGSFSLLNLTHICVVLQSMKDSGLESNLSTFLINGDDGVLPEVIIKSYNDIWINNAAEGIKSADKSTDTSTFFVEFCKQYVCDENRPQPLNGLRYKSYIKLLLNPKIIMILGNRYQKTDFYKSFLILKKRLESLESHYDISGTISVPIFDNLELRFKIYSIIKELRLKYLSHIIEDPGVRTLFRDLIDNSNDSFNIFDREKWYPDKEYTNSDDWETIYGPFPIIDKFNLKINGLIQFNIIEVIDYIVKNKTFPIEIVELGKYDRDLYHELYNLVIPKKESIYVESDFVRRTVNLELHVGIERIKSNYKVLISTDFTDIDHITESVVIDSH